MTPATRNLLIALAVIATACILAHIVARQSALRYGQDLAVAASAFTIDTIAKTQDFEQLLDGPAFSKHTRTIGLMWVFGKSYLDKIDSLKATLLYFSENAALPKEQRFRDPEKNQLHGTGANTDDEFIKDRVFDLVKSFIETV